MKMRKKVILQLMRWNVVVLLLLLMSTAAYAVPAKPGVRRQLKLDDGTTVSAMLVGDEHGHYWLGTNGKTYLTVDRDDKAMEVNLEGIKEQAQERRLAVDQRRARRLAAAKKVGTVGEYIGEKKGLILLVNFSDVSFKNANDNALYQRIANEENFSEGQFHGSVYDYFYAQSEGQFKLTFDVVGPYTVSKNQSYYGSNNARGDDKYPATMGGKVWWHEIDEKYGIRLQQNFVTGHYRLLDAENCRLISSFSKDEVEEYRNITPVNYWQEIENGN